MSTSIIGVFFEFFFVVGFLGCGLVLGNTSFKGIIHYIIMKAFAVNSSHLKNILVN